jgi:pimeloyl-ACP methyl ester carboxylesterase
VPETWGEPDGRQITLRIHVLRSRSEDPAGAVFVLAGGPGQAATELATMIADEHGGIRESRDIVLLDQRGSGGSRPLRCDTPDPEDTPAELRAI